MDPFRTPWDTRKAKNGREAVYLKDFLATAEICHSIMLLLHMSEGYMLSFQLMVSLSFLCPSDI